MYQINIALFRSQCHLNLFGDVSDQVQNFVGVTGFVVVPGYQFHEVVVQSDTCLLYTSRCV